MAESKGFTTSNIMPQKPVGPEGASFKAPGVPPVPTMPPTPFEVDTRNLLTDDSIVAKPLGHVDFTAVKTKNPNLAFVWANRMFNNGLRLEEFYGQGYRKATPVDCEVPGVSPKDGGFVYGDLMLLKIDRAAYLGQLKYNALKAVRSVRPNAFKEQGTATLQQETGSQGKVAMAEGKLTPYVPTESELQEKVGG